MPHINENEYETVKLLQSSMVRKVYIASGQTVTLSLAVARDLVAKGVAVRTTFDPSAVPAAADKPRRTVPVAHAVRTAALKQGRGGRERTP